MKEYSRQGEREVVLERKQAVLLFVGGVCALVLVFALGVLVGKNLANLKQSKGQAQATKQAAFPPETKPASGATAESAIAKGSTALTAEPATGETAKIMQKIQEQQPPPQITGTAKGSTAKPTTAAPAPTTTTKPTPTPTTVKPTTPATTTKPSTTTAPTAPTKPAPLKLPNFAIQVAAFPDQPQADALVSKLKANKWDAYSVPTDIPGKGTWYRVYVGRYDTRTLADKGLAVFKSKEPLHQDAFIRKME